MPRARKANNPKSEHGREASVHQVTGKEIILTVTHSCGHSVSYAVEVGGANPVKWTSQPCFGCKPKNTTGRICPDCQHLYRGATCEYCRRYPDIRARVQEQEAALEKSRQDKDEFIRVFGEAAWTEKVNREIQEVI